MLQKAKVKNAFKWQVLSVSTQAVLQLAYIMVSARVLPKEAHGAYAIINSFIFILNITSQGGMSPAIIQSKKVNKTHISIAFYSTLALSLLMFLLMCVFSGLIAKFYDFKISRFELIAASLIFIFEALGSVSRALLIRKFRFKELFISSSSGFFIGNIVIMYILSLYGYGVYSLIFGFVTTKLLVAIFLHSFAKHSYRFSWKKEEFKYLLKFGSSSILLNITNYLSSQIDKLLLGKYFSTTTLSIYERGQFISKMPTKYIGNGLDPIMFSSFSKMEEKKEKGYFFSEILKIVLSIMAIAAVLTYFNSESIIKLILGDKWMKSLPLLKIFTVMMPAMILARIGDIITRSENKMFQSVWVKVGFLGALILTIFGAKSNSMVYITKLIAIVYWLHAIAMFLLSLSILKLNIKQYIKPFITPIIITCIFVLKYYLIQTINNLDQLIVLILNLILDGIIIIGIGYYFRNHSIIKAFRKNKNRNS